MRRVPATLLKRLERVEQTRSTKRPRAAFPPIIYDCDEWSVLAEASQERLVFETREHLHVSPDAVVTDHDPADVTHRYKPGGRIFGTEVRSIR